MNDVDGNFTFSPIRILNINASRQKIVVSPNPVVTTTSLSIRVDSKQEAVYKIVDANGRFIRQQKVMLEKGDNHIGITLSALPSGNYTLIVSGKNLERSLRLIKQ